MENKIKAIFYTILIIVSIVGFFICLCLFPMIVLKIFTTVALIIFGGMFGTVLVYFVFAIYEMVLDYLNQK